LGAVVFAMLRLVLRRCSANARYIAACAMLGLLVAAPILSAFWLPGYWSRPTLVGIAKDTTLIGNPVLAAIPRTPVSLVFSHSAAGLWDPARQLNQILPWVVEFWLIGVLALSCRWICGNRWVRRVKTFKTEPLEDLWQCRLRELSQRLGIARRVVLLQSAWIEVPMVIGWLKPVILLPASALSGLTPAQLEAILAHELAHVRRYDYLVNWFQTLAETLMFYHPAVWWVSRCIRNEREHCCDDLVVRVCGDKVLYARALVTLEEARGVPPLAFAASGGSLLQRVRRLLGIAHEDQPPSAAEFGGLALVALGCVFVLSALWIFNRPALYETAALIRLNPSLALAAVTTDSNSGTAAAYFPYFLQTECLVMRSPAVLKRVAQSLRLGEAAAVLNSLRARLEVRPVPSTSAIEIRAADSDPAQAARIANALAAVYRDYRVQKNENSVRENMESLETSVAAQEDQVRKAEAKMNGIRSQSKASDAVVLDGEPVVQLSAESLRHIEALRIEAEAEYVKEKTLLDQLGTLESNKLAETIPAIGVQDNQLNEYMQALALVDQKLIALQAELGPEHSEVKKALAQQTDLRQKISRRTDGIIAGLRAKTSATCQSLVALSNAVQQAVQADSDRAKAGEQYLDAQRDLADLLQFKSVLQNKLAMERARTQPQNLVEIVEEAESPAQPLSADRARAISFCGVGLLLILTGGILTRVGHRNALVARLGS
jgi:beta-lactamase regulating signal transducer with metallopeptidase domain/uncharacterized protein involved in exopolysaccharide biosynthesis